MIQRRNLVSSATAFVVLSALTALVTFAFAQQPRVYRIGYLANNLDVQAPTPTYKAFVEGLTERGWVEGRNIEIRAKSANGQAKLFPALVADLMAEKVDVIVTGSLAATQAAKAATTTIPIVFGSAADPLEHKLVASYAHPGGNVTGLMSRTDVGAKRYEILKDIRPRSKRFMRLYQADRNVATQQAIIDQDNAAARTLGIAIEHRGVVTLKEIENAFREAKKRGVDGINVKADALLVEHRATIGKLSVEHKVPVIGADRRFAEAGALASYGESAEARYRKAAVVVDKILRGTKPDNIPVEQLNVFELVINTRTAQALGIAIPDEVALQATQIN